VTPPVAVRVVFCPWQIATLEPAFIAGNGLTEIVKLAIFTQVVAAVPETE
jgi:hypothetical protein